MFYTEYLGVQCLPNEAEYFSTYAKFSGFFICDNTFVCRKDCCSESSEYSRDILCSSIHTQTWFGDSLQTRDNFFVLVCTIFQCNMDCFKVSIFYDIIFCMKCK